jgi:hypothetical protein
MTDTDGDGLDDILEALLGTSITDADTDNDQLSDLDEHLLGTDPLVFDSSGRVRSLSQALKMDIYSNGVDVVVQISALYSQAVQGVHLYVADENRFMQLSWRFLASFQNDLRQLPSAVAGLDSQVYRVKMPARLFKQFPEMAIGITANIDGTAYGEQIQLLTRVNHLLEYRDGETFGRQAQQGGPTGGLFPTSPGNSLPGEISFGQICVQTLQEGAALGAGQKLYQITDSYCDYLPDAACFSSCSAAIGDSVVGIDIVGLLGG